LTNSPISLAINLPADVKYIRKQLKLQLSAAMQSKSYQAVMHV